jgi:hypothetical protein
MIVSAQWRGLRWTAVAVLCALMSLFALPAVAVGPASMDFGGMYGSGGPLPGHGFTNPITHAQYCLDGYKAYKVLGTAHVDWPLYWCGRPHLEGRPAEYDFGGMYSFTSENNRGVVPWKGQFAYVNPFTFTDSCPPGIGLHECWAPTTSTISSSFATGRTPKRARAWTSRDSAVTAIRLIPIR